MKWGWSLSLVDLCSYFFTWPCFASEGSRLPSKWARFLGFLMHLALAMLSFLSTNKNQKENSKKNRKKEEEEKVKDFGPAGSLPMKESVSWAE